MAWDAIVVGSGINGLAAAVHLGSKGWKVLVLERAAVPGGAVKTAELTLPGYAHDACAMNLSMFAGSPFYAAHKAKLDAAGLELLPAGKSFASVLPGGTWLGVESDAAQTMARIAARNPQDAAAWGQMLSEFGTVAPHLFAVLGSPVPSFAVLKALWRAWRALGTAKCMELAKLMVSSPRAWLGAHFQDPGVQAMMGAWGMHLDFGPDVAGGALFPYLESMASQAFGMALGRGGVQTVVQAMVKVIAQQGGEVRCNATVERIETNEGQAKGVLLQGGERLQATRAVIANVHPKLLYGKLLASGSPAAAQPAPSRLRSGPGTMMIHLAMAQMPQWAAGQELQEFAYVHLAPTLDHMARTYADAMAGLLPAEPVLVVGQPTAFDAGRAPAGKHLLWVQVRVLPSVVQGDAAGAIAPAHWDQIKEAYADRVMAVLERYAPGLGAQVLARTVVSPVDLERENPNLVDGDSLSGSHHLDQFFCFRPAFGHSRWRTPVKQLYMVGASTWPGAGTGAGSGYMLAKGLAGA
ncbi:phytoene desaturase family protein [Rhodoferax aquaticus]|uniref:Pyridine nucleotide-disulfide oxidoreductase domain-containing protein 2 n=1 Tax=Rhodoferax aquaticus TaxID=2527691 RepID=A0A515EQ15_9BURK|nr:NAD(P)/FAD-dependent oxidoreductase [Rhodoferax aquaticus]QDL54764.1 NAD(P)/FAD-dependent oxidoreductase [Rhodoferax aquaticus]